MKDLIKKILREENEAESENEFSWVKEIIPFEKDLDPIEVFVLFGGFTDEVKSTVASDFERSFSDIWVKGDRVLLGVDHYCDFADLFYDGRGGDSYVNKYLFKEIYCNEDYFELFDNVVTDWKREVWEAVTDSPTLTRYVLDYIKGFITPENYNPNQLDIYGELPRKIKSEYVGKDLFSQGNFDYLSQNLEELGDLINSDGELFNGLKWELGNSYGEAYNRVVSDNIHNAAVSDIYGTFGRGEWGTRSKETYGGPTRERRLLFFDITDMFWQILNDFYESQVVECNIPEDKKNDLEYFNEHCYSNEAFSEFSSFLEMYNGIVEPRFNPRFDEYPYGPELSEAFEEAVYARI